MTRWLTEEQQTAWLGLISMTAVLPTALDAQLRKDSDLTHFEYMVLSMLSDSPGRIMRMTQLAQRTTATLPRLSHVVRRLEERGLVQRSACPEDGRATNAELTEEGWRVLVDAAPGHVDTVRALVIDALTDEQIDELAGISRSILDRLVPNGTTRAG